MSQSTEPRLNSLFRIQTILLLQAPKSGYDLAKDLEEMTGKKPSSGKIYPFLHQLKDGEYIDEIEEEDDSERSKTVYQLTKRGQELVDELIDRMGNLLDARLEQMLDTCFHCGVKLYESKITEEDENGRSVVFCCEHCKGAYYDDVPI